MFLFRFLLLSGAGTNQDPIRVASRWTFTPGVGTFLFAPGSPGWVYNSGARGWLYVP